MILPITFYKAEYRKASPLCATPRVRLYGHLDHELLVYQYPIHRVPHGLPSATEVDKFDVVTRNCDIGYFSSRTPDGGFHYIKEVL